jgi:hypothetical protein
MSEKEMQEIPPPAYTVQPQAAPEKPSTYQPAQVQPGSAPPDYLILSLFTLLCCFTPLGIVALIKSVETRKHIQYGMYSNAAITSKEAKKFNIFSIGVGVAIQVAVWIFVICIVGIQLGLTFGLRSRD